MRLGKAALGCVEEQVSKAWAGECVVEVPAPSLSLARKVFAAVSPHIEQRGGRPDVRRMKWSLSNGSEIRIVTDQAG